jgi:hypothetical protein
MDTMDPAGEGRRQSEKKPSLTGRSSRARLAILRALDTLGESAGALKIAETLGGSGVELPARTIRFHLSRMDREGLTRSVAHEGRQITDLGKKELARSSVMHKIGFVASKIDELAYRMSFDPKQGSGTVVANGAIISKADLSRSLYFMKTVFSAGLAMGDRIAIGMAGHRIGELDVARGKMVVATISSATINGLFLKAGIPVTSRFGGLVAIEDGAARRVIELTEYKGATCDPHALFIKAGMTGVGRCASTGSGIAGVSICEFPSIAVDKARELIARLGAMHLNCVLAVGQPNRPLLDVSVGEGRTAMMILDGLNPLAALHEAGIPAELRPLSGLEELSSFVPFNEIAPMGRRSTLVD